METPRLKALRRRLYLVCRDLLPAGNQYDEAVKTLRDHVVFKQFGKSASDLAEQEIIDLIAFLQPSKDAKLITARQIQAIRFYGIICAIVYANFKGFSKNIDGRQQLEGENLRRWIRTQYDQKKQLPSNIVNMLFEEWINPSCNKYLVEGGLRRRCKDYSKLYYERLTAEEGSYLINRLSQIYQNINNKREAPIYPQLN